MRNVLYDLSKAMELYGIEGTLSYRNYKPIPKSKPDAPCIEVDILEGKVIRLLRVPQQQAVILRKYGTKQGSYPCMNLAPLYRITSDEMKKELKRIREKPELLNADKIDEVREWCQEKNWVKKFLNKYKICMVNMSKELSNLVPNYLPIQILIRESNYFLEPEQLFEQLKVAAFKMLEAKEDVALALDVLFYSVNSEKAGTDDYGSISIALNSPALLEAGISAISEKFVSEVNKNLLDTEAVGNNTAGESLDAFGVPFDPFEEPMPEVRLAGGFDVILRTMFKGQPSQTRYARIENGSYPISRAMRKNFQASLTWLGSAEQRDITWCNIDKDDILFVYPSRLPDTKTSFTNVFKRPKPGAPAFKKQAEMFLKELRNSKQPEADSWTNRIQLFIVKKVAKGRTKIVYTRQTDPKELERQSEEWNCGCADNLPRFPFGEPRVPFPLEVADILNRFWKQNGSLATDKFKPFSCYWGMTLMMNPEVSTESCVRRLSQEAVNVGAFVGNKLACSQMKNWSPKDWDTINKIKDMLALIGLLLYRNGVRKETYMENTPYLYGQLLKAADELHIMYCRVVRDGSVPTQLVGASMFQSAAESPIRTLAMLSQRMIPYYAWAKSYRTKGIEEAGKESKIVGWLYSISENIATKIENTWDSKYRFNEEEKAQLFIGYLAAFPKKEKDETK